MEECEFKDIIRYLKGIFFFKYLQTYCFYVLVIVDGGMLMNIAEKILGLLDYQSLKSAEQVSPHWHQVVVSGNLYRNLYQRNVSVHAES